MSSRLGFESQAGQVKSTNKKRPGPFDSSSTSSLLQLRVQGAFNAVKIGLEGEACLDHSGLDDFFCSFFQVDLAIAIQIAEGLTEVPG